VHSGPGSGLGLPNQKREACGHLVSPRRCQLVPGGIGSWVVNHAQGSCARLYLAGLVLLVTTVACYCTLDIINTCTFDAVLLMAQLCPFQQRSSTEWLSSCSDRHVYLNINALCLINTDEWCLRCASLIFQMITLIDIYRQPCYETNIYQR
jgi:hypothetical protein